MLLPQQGREGGREGGGREGGRERGCLWQATGKRGYLEHAKRTYDVCCSPNKVGIMILFLIYFIHLFIYLFIHVLTYLFIYSLLIN